MFILNEKNSILYVNPVVKKRLGYSEKELLGMSMLKIYPPEQRENAEDIIKNIIAGETSESSIPLMTKDRKLISVETRLSQGKWSGQNVLFSISRDITKHKQALQKAHATVEELNESLRVINSILRHDILHDLTVIRGHLELYQLERDETDLDQAYKAIDKSADLITRMRELEYLVLRDEPLQPYNIRETVDLVLKNHETSTVEFNVKGQDLVLADQALSSVIDNLIRNALAHANTERVDITIDDKDDFCEVRIADYGVGIPDKIKSQIFDPGFKYGEAGHMGLGLYIVKKVVERYGGEVWVEDNAPTGTVFVLKLRKAEKIS